MTWIRKRLYLYSTEHAGIHVDTGYINIKIKKMQRLQIIKTKQSMSIPNPNYIEIAHHKFNNINSRKTTTQSSGYKTLYDFINHKDKDYQPLVDEKTYELDLEKDYRKFL